MSRAVIVDYFKFVDHPKIWNFIDRTGEKFGSLTVLGWLGNGKWGCQCNCGNKVSIFTSNLKRGNTVSCGCAHTKWVIKNKTKHGHARSLGRSSVYNIHQSMIQRCKKPCNNKHYERGIQVCDRWVSGEDGYSGFECFLKDMGDRPSNKHSIDRIDNDGNYEPSNCRWSTRKEQGRNTTRNRLVVLHGLTMTMVEASEKMGFGRDTIRLRMKRGWQEYDAIHTPSLKRGQRLDK